MHSSSKTFYVPEKQPNTQRIVIIGGGFAGINLAKRLVNNSKFQIVMLDRHNYHLFQPLLYQVATSGLEPDSIASPIRKMFHKARNFIFRNAKVESIDYKLKQIHTHVGSLGYDYLVIANGAKTNYFGNEEKFYNALPMKQLHHALAVRNHVLSMIEEAVETESLTLRQACLTFTIVGGGATGVEVAGALDELKKHVIPKDYPEIDSTHIRIILIEGGGKLLAAMKEKSSDRSLKYLQNLGVEVILNTTITSFDGNNILLSNGKIIPSRTLVWGAGVSGNIIDGLPNECIERGRFIVNEFNAIKGISDVFAIGDIALMKTEEYPNGHPMVAPVAVQAGKNLAQNFDLLLKKEGLKPFKYKNSGSMATIGRNLAVVDFPYKIKIGGRLAWILWMFVHLMSITGFRNKVLVSVSWFWSYLTFDRANRIIIRNFEKKVTNAPQDEMEYLEKENKNMSTF